MTNFLIIAIAIIAFIVAISIVAAIVVAIVLTTTQKSSPKSHHETRQAQRKVVQVQPKPTLNELRGSLGERFVENILGENVVGEKYVLNGYIYERNGRSTEIDHIVINTYGVFVIETKNRAGDIYGNDTDEEWIQKLGNGDTVHHFRNPVMQNAAHVSKIKSILGNEIPIHSLVVFVKNNTENIYSDVVIPLADLGQTINSGIPKLSAGQINTVYQSLQRQRSTMTHEEHKRKIQQQNYNLKYNHICPICNSELTIEQDMCDKYYVCSNPKCKFTKKLD